MSNSTSFHRQILGIALPAIVSNITVPLLGLVDVAIVGHLGAASYIGAIAVGGMLFNMIYWLFGFLRMGTSGLTAQAYGRKDPTEAMRLLLRSTGIGMAIATVLIVLQVPLRSAAFLFVDTSPEVRELATRYFHICIWGAPATLGLYSLTGWFIGMQNSRYPMLVAIAQNVVNILGSLLFVYGCGLKVEGVALGTLIAQYAGLLMAVALWRRRYASLPFPRQEVWQPAAMRRFFQVNRDIFLRTVCLVSVMTFFTATGAAYGDDLLAVNTLLMQLFTFFSYVMDGFAYAGEALAGRYTGAADRASFRLTLRSLFQWGIGLSAAFTLTYAVGGRPFLGLLTDNAEVLTLATAWFPWVLAIPFAGFTAFLMDGICIGATATRIMLWGVAVASVCFFALYFGIRAEYGNHALWLAFIVYLVVRGGVSLFLTLRKEQKNTPVYLL